MARLEILPFGDIGSLSETPFENFQDAKLLIGFAAYRNDNAVRSKGTLGSDLFEQSDISQKMLDFLFKYKTFSIVGEYFERTTDNTLTFNTDSSTSAKVMVGKGYSISLSQVVNKSTCIAARYSSIEPDDKLIEVDKLKEYSIRFKKLLSNLIIQSDVSYLDYDNFIGKAEDEIRLRLNIILSI